LTGFRAAGSSRRVVVSALIERIVDLGFEWGVSDGT
jgi:hypothetical protein